MPGLRKNDSQATSAAVTTIPACQTGPTSPQPPQPLAHALAAAGKLASRHGAKRRHVGSASACRLADVMAEERPSSPGERISPACALPLRVRKRCVIVLACGCVQSLRSCRSVLCTLPCVREPQSRGHPASMLLPASPPPPLSAQVSLGACSLPFC